MDERWYNAHGPNDDVILVSRVRLLRNFADYKFPESLTENELISLDQEVDQKLNKLSNLTGRITKASMNVMDNEDKAALNERLLINKGTMKLNRPYTVYASSDESFSMTVNGEDHLRLLLSGRGQKLSEIYKKMDRIDDYIHSKMPFAYSEKFGYKTSDIANLGTGMRAYYVMHLPLLSEEKNFNALMQEISRYGVVIKDAWNAGKNKVGGLYVLYNQRTLGLQEKDIIEVLTSVSNRLMKEERELRKGASEITIRDRIMRSYGILKYAAKMDLQESCKHLSNLMLGVSMGYLKVNTDLSIYELMIGTLPGNLQMFFRKTMDEHEMKIKRAEYLSAFMNDIQIVSRDM